MDPVHYKGFYIVVKVERETETKYKVSNQISRNSKGAPVTRSWLGVQEFADERTAYDFGLQEARTWIDEEQNR